MLYIFCCFTVLFVSIDLKKNPSCFVETFRLSSLSPPSCEAELEEEDFKTLLPVWEEDGASHQL